MKTAIASLALPLLAAAAPAPQAPAVHAPVTRAEAPAFGVMAARSASPIHYLQMNADGGNFWLGGKTSSYCPNAQVSACPPGNQTVFAAGGNALVRGIAQQKKMQKKKRKGTNRCSIGC